MASGLETNDILGLFHHVHHINGGHKVHHCGGAHVEVDPMVNYTIQHCQCGKHAINKQSAIGHGADSTLCKVPITVIFPETCPDGGWHVESGQVASSFRESAGLNVPELEVGSFVSQ